MLKIFIILVLLVLLGLCLFIVQRKKRKRRQSSAYVPLRIKPEHIQILYTPIGYIEAGRIAMEEIQMAQSQNREGTK